MPFNPPCPVAGRVFLATIWLGGVGFVPAFGWREARAEFGWTGELAGDTLTFERGGRRTTLDLRSLDRLDWPRMKDGALTLAGPGGTVRLTPKVLEPAIRLAFVRRLRAAVPEEVQRRWPRYCWVAALDLIRCELLTRPLRPGERVMTEPFSAGFTFACVMSGEVAGWLCWWLTGRASYLIIGPAMGLIVPALRWAGRRSRRPVILPPPGESPADREARAAAEWAALQGRRCTGDARGRVVR